MSEPIPFDLLVRLSCGCSGILAAESYWSSYRRMNFCPQHAEKIRLELEEKEVLGSVIISTTAQQLSHCLLLKALQHRNQLFFFRSCSL